MCATQFSLIVFLFATISWLSHTRNTTTVFYLNNDTRKAQGKGAPPKELLADSNAFGGF